MNFLIAIIGAAALIGFIVLVRFLSKKANEDKWTPKSAYTKDGCILKKDAVVTNLDTRKYNDTKFKTTVTFSDGFQYISYDTRSERTGLLKYNIIVDTDMKKAILNRAVEKHAELIRIADLILQAKENVGEP